MARKKTTQVQDAVAYIQQKITTYEMPPGTPISDSALAQELNMSRSPIREALLLLQTDGLVDYSDGKARVSPITMSDILEICQVCQTVEAGAVRIIAQRGGFTSEQCQRLAACHQQLIDQSANEHADLMDVYGVDDDFHLQLVQCAGNSRLVDIANRMRLQMQRVRWLNVVLPSRRETANLEHKAILMAIEKNDFDGIVAHITTHYHNTADNLKQLLTDRKYQMAIASMQFIGLN